MMESFKVNELIKLVIVFVMIFELMTNVMFQLHVQYIKINYHV